MNETALLSPDDIKSEEEFKLSRKKLTELLTEAKHVKTPENQLEKKGDFLYPAFEYMESQMDIFHPRRAVLSKNEHYDPQSLTYSFTVEVMDLVTGEVRVGTSVHPIIAYESGTDNLKSNKQIRQLMGNAKKASLTEAIRDAYAHFGISADLYKMTAREQPNEEQTNRFNLLIKDLKLESQQKLKEKWATHFADTADEFLDNIEKAIKEKLSQTQTA